MIAANELRLGNWIINKHGEYQRVFNLNDDGMRIHHKLTVQVNCEPIPLTTEILEKCGFNLQPQRISIYVNGRIKLWLGSNGVIAYLMHEDKNESFWISNPVQNLHQLQNLYYCLTGTELSIKI